MHRWTKDPSSSGEDPAAEGDKTRAAHRPNRSVQPFWCVVGEKDARIVAIGVMR